MAFATTVSGARGLDVELMNPALAKLDGMPTRRDRLLDRGGANPVDLDATALDETARLRCGGHPPRFLDHLPQRPPRRLGRQALGVFELVGPVRGDGPVPAEPRGAHRLGLSH